MKDKKTISNAVHEITAAAKACKVEPIVIHLAKHILKTNDGAEIYAWVDKHRGSSVEECRANALVMSNALETLEMLQHVVDTLEDSVNAAVEWILRVNRIN